MGGQRGIALNESSANSPEPCTEAGKEVYLGKTFISTVVSEGQEPQTIYGVILCPNQWRNEPKVKIWPTLETGFTAEPQDGNKYAYPAHYNSFSGNLVHEMAHVVARVKGGNCKSGEQEEGANHGC